LAFKSEQKFDSKEKSDRLLKKYLIGTKNREFVPYKEENSFVQKA